MSVFKVPNRALTARELPQVYTGLWRLKHDCYKRAAWILIIMNLETWDKTVQRFLWL